VKLFEQNVLARRVYYK